MQSLKLHAVDLRMHDLTPGSAWWAPYHDEVVAALREIGNARYGAYIARDRRSSMDHLGIRFPVLRKRVKEGSRSTAYPGKRYSRSGITSCARPLTATSSSQLSSTTPRSSDDGRIPRSGLFVRHWHERVDNWCHSDGLSSLYSFLLASDPDEVYPQLEVWSRSSDQWTRRISIVSLIHPSGKNAVFMPLDRALPLVTTCLEDEREYVQKAVGWVLRELGQAHPDEVRAYLEEHIATIPALALRRAIERPNPA